MEQNREINSTVDQPEEVETGNERKVDQESDDESEKENKKLPVKKLRDERRIIKDVRPYLQSTVIPILVAAVSSVATVRPDDPIQYLADFLIRYKYKYTYRGAGEGASR